MSALTPKVLLIYPPSRTQAHATCPMGLLMLAATLEKAGHRVEVMDANACNRRLTTDQIVQHAADVRPDVIGVTMVTPLVKETYRLAGKLRGCGATLIAGGPHATLLPEEPLARGFDAVVVGEGEPTVVEAVQAVLGHLPVDSVAGLVHRLGDGQIRHNPLRPPVADLDSLPQPARHLVDPNLYCREDHAGLHANLFTSRGCPARCAYCAGGLFGKKFRFRSADGVLEEMLLIHRSYGTTHFHFVDDAMTMDRSRVEQICQNLIDLGRGFTWSMMTRIDAVDEELLALAAKVGCRRIDYGVESGNPETLSRIHKPHTAEMVRKVIPLTHRHGIRPAVFFILGFPWEDVPALDETLRLMIDLAPYVDFHPAVASILIPFPATQIYDRYKDQYGFERWWLSDDRTYDAPRVETHPYYQSVLCRIGGVLDADFFHYSPAVKAKIFELLRFMYAHNLRERPFMARTIRLAAVDFSQRLHAVSPRVERAVFRGPERIQNSLRRITLGYSQ